MVVNYVEAIIIWNLWILNLFGICIEDMWSYFLDFVNVKGTELSKKSCIMVSMWWGGLECWFERV